MASEFPNFISYEDGTKTGRLILGEGAYRRTLMMVNQSDRGRILEETDQGEVVGIIFYGAGTDIEAVRRKTSHYITPPDLPDVDITGLPQQPGIPDEGELTLLLNEQGLVPLVSHDLIPG